METDMAFIGRERELTDLRTEFTSDRPSLVIVYGRRRIGKSTLIQQAAKSVETSVYFQATTLEDEQNLTAFKAEIQQSLGDDGLLGGITDWTSVFNWLAQKAKSHQGLVVILDEFPYLSDNRTALPSIIQKLWDSGVMAAGNLKLVLCGSLISYMEELLTERNPLFGRRTMSMELGQMTLREASQFLPAYSSVDKITAYSVLGGVPYYLQLCDQQQSLRENIVRIVMSKSGQLFDEPEFLLQSELREPKRYASVIAAVANGAKKLSEIIGRVGFKDTSQITPYVTQLVRLGLLERQKSFDASPRERDARYAVADPLMRFWYSFVGPNLSTISRGFGGAVFDRIVQPQLAEYMGLEFESVCREHLRLHAQERFSVPAQGIGKIWSADYDLDVTGKLLDGSWIFGECKWQNQRIGESMLSDLKSSAEAAMKGVPAASSHFVLFSKAGFTPELARLAEADSHIVLYSIDDLVEPNHPYYPQSSW
jgi:AAA+ ATPase superfamily predicted ATPase